MKARLKYPIFSFAPKGNMIYVFRKEELVHNDQYRVVEEAEELHCSGCNRDEIC